MKNITFRADAATIDAARTRARVENTTVAAEFRRWLADYVDAGQRMAHYDLAMRTLRGKLMVGYRPSRDEMNER